MRQKKIWFFISSFYSNNTYRYKIKKLNIQISIDDDRIDTTWTHSKPKINEYDFYFAHYLRG